MKFELTKYTSNFIKIIAALMVMLNHYSQYVLSNGLSNNIIYKMLSTQGGFLGVAIFFFLSGYGLMESEKLRHLNFLDFIKKRILKIYIPVFVITFIWFFITTLILPQPAFNTFELPIGKDNSLLISNIFIEFGDSVLWFIKVLLLLYLNFYIFSVIRIKNKNLSIIFLSITLFIVIFFVYHTFFDFQSISIPYFYLGIGVSICRYSTSKMFSFVVGVLFMVILYSLAFFNSALAFHSIFNVLALGCFIIIFSLKHIDIKVPAFIGAVSFDIYLVHNKVLMTLKNNYEVVNVGVFIILTIVITSLFYLLRTHLLSLKK